jgi:hypothetical protein
VLKMRSRVIVMLGTFLLGVAATGLLLLSERDAVGPHGTPPTTQGHQGLRLEIPDARWEPGFFKLLDEHSDDVTLPSLRQRVLPGGDIEARFWYDGRPYVVRGFVFRRSGEKWSAFYIDLPQGQGRPKLEQQSLPEPKSGWAGAWDKLVGAGILVLPDEPKTQCSSGALDGVGYVVETNSAGTYRTYRYDNPKNAGCDEAARIITIEETIANEFGIKNSHR